MTELGALLATIREGLVRMARASAVVRASEDHRRSVALDWLAEDGRLARALAAAAPNPIHEGIVSAFDVLAALRSDE